jgi:lysine 6-dehydrogenase
MGSRYLVLGTGVGKAVAYALLKNPKNFVAIADIDLKTATDTQRALYKMPGLSNCSCLPIEFKAGNTDHVALFNYFDIIISALPAKYNLELAEAAIKANVHFCDLGGVVEVTTQMLELNKKYPNTSVSVVPDCGLMPGLGIVIAKKLMQDLGGADSIEILVGGLPQKPQLPTHYQLVFNSEGLRHVCYDPAPILSEGEVKLVKPFHDYRLSNIPELRRFSKKFNGNIESFVTAGASLAANSFRDWGVRYFTERTVRWPGFVDFFKNITEDKFEQAVKKHLTIPVDTENPDMVWMQVMVQSGLREKSMSLLDLFDTETNLTAMQRTTGFTTAVIAEMMAEGKTKTGVNTPENAFNHLSINEIIDKVGNLLALK